MDDLDALPLVEKREKNTRDSDGLHKRRGYWYYIRRVPDRARPVDPRKWINKTTGIRIADDPRGISASARAAQLETSLLAEWEDLLAGRNPAPAIAFARNVDIAKRYGLTYFAHDEVSQLPAERFYGRLDIIATKPTPEVASDMMGTVSKLRGCPVGGCRFCRDCGSRGEVENGTSPVSARDRSILYSRRQRPERFGPLVDVNAVRGTGS
jgi:hypothetical protein